MDKTLKCGLLLLLQKGRTLFLMILAVPVVFLVRIVRPLMVIRFGPLLSRRIGAFIANTEVYLCERDAGMHPPRTLDIFYHYLPVSNLQVKKMWERTGKLNISPFTSFTHILNRLNCLLPGGQQHMIPIASDTDRYGLRTRTKVYFSFTVDEEYLGRQALQKLGITDGASFICFHARDTAYLDTVFPNCNWSWHYLDYRNSSVHNYLPAAQELVHRGYFMLRMGAAVKEALTINNPMIIDYAIKGRTDFLDIYAGAKCRFFICDSSGISSVPTVFRRPIAWVNYIPLGNMPTGGAPALLIPKKLWLRNERRFLTFREILDSDIKKFSWTENYEQLGIELVENTPEEITALALEMDERLKGIWQTSLEDEELQRRFWGLFKPSDLTQIVASRRHTRIGAEFLRQNHEFF